MEELEPNITQREEEALERASGLLDALMDDSVADVTKAKIQQWFVSDMSKNEKYEALKKLFIDLRPNLKHDRHEYEQYAKISKILGFDDVSGTPVPKRRPGLRRYAMRVAAVLIPAFVIAGAVYLWVERAGETAGQYPVANVSVSVAADGQKRVVLPDGSEVWVNESSTISYNDDFSAERFVSLTGEAFFSVVRDTAVPFRVRTADLLVEVLGTEFNIKTYADDPTAEVILTSGSVQVRASKNRPVELVPNERLTLDRSSLKVTRDIILGDTVSDWRVRNLHFVDTPIDSALRAISAYYGRDLSMQAWKHHDDLINLTLDRELPLEQVLSVIRNITDDFTYEITDKEIIIKQLPQGDN